MGGMPKHARMWLQVMTGPGLAKLVETMVGALNSREIPTAGSILEHFNADLVQKVGAAVHLSHLAITSACELGILQVINRSSAATLVSRRATAAAQVKGAYIQQLESLALPVQEEELDRMHKAALEAALGSFDSASFGVPGSSELQVTHPAPGYLSAQCKHEESSCPGTHLCFLSNPSIQVACRVVD